MSEPRTLEADAGTVSEVAAELTRARRVLFVTGAGLSADSGLPTYRGVGGLYDDDTTEDGIAIEEAVSGGVFASRPEITWKYLHRMNAAARQAGHNDGHRVIAEIERELGDVWVLTQNVDGFHGDAGSTNVIEVHGNGRELHCTACSWSETRWDYSDLPELPRCPSCGAVIRPRVVLFDEMLPEEAMSALTGELRRPFEMVFSVGTTSLFPYIAAPVVEAQRAGAPTVEINPEQTPVSDVVQYRIPAPAAPTLRTIWDRCRAGRPD